MKNSFAPIFTSMLDSSVWTEDYSVRVLWTALLALKESDHVVRLTAFQIARRANMTEKEVIKAMNILCAPDTKRLEKQPFDGRRVKKTEDGWMVLNGQKYEDLMRTVSRRAYNARKQREYRSKKPLHPSLPSAGEREYEQAIRAGANEEQLDAIVEKYLKK